MLLQVERSQIEYDLTSPAVTNEPERIKKLMHIFDDPYEVVKDAHAIVVLTEWDEFKVSRAQCLLVTMLQGASAKCG